MLNERRRRVLAALVEEYIESATPVGSKTLVERYELGCSPATVRNELSILEETGFVLQPHVSAGRLPTDTGYRSFVDDLIESGRSVARRSSSATRHGSPAPSEVDDLMRETSVALTQLTNCLAVVLAPSVSLSRVRRIDLLSLTAASGRVRADHGVGPGRQPHDRARAEDIAPERLAEIERAMNAALDGKHAADIRPLRGRDRGDPRSRRARRRSSSTRFSTRSTRPTATASSTSGVPALLAQPEFHDADRARPLIEFLEDGIAVLEALSEALGTREITVRIGHENRRAELGNVSIVATNYGAGRR